MSPDEVFVTAVAIAVGPILWAVWLARMARLEMVRGRPGSVVAIAAALTACGLSIFVVLKAGASSDVVDSPEYLFMYVVVGLAWVRAVQSMFPYLGLSPRDDVFERRNKAAVLLLIGAMLGVTLCYAGGNVGDGPGWWVVIFSAGLATAALMISWAILGQLTPVNDAVVIDRDRAAGIRLGAYLVTCGLILGRGVAGDWISASGAILDLTRALPAIVVILLLAVFVERLARPTARRPYGPVFAFGVLPAALYLLVGVAAVSWKGWPA
jgi:uncharacterized membrane protein YjfL (UPF0719 family)